MFRVLLLDGDAAARTALEKGVSWESLGVTEVLQAEDAVAARKLLSSEIIDIIISEVDLPGSSGLNVLRWVRANHIPSELVFVTTQEDFQSAVSALRDRAWDYFCKPVDCKALEKCLRSLVLKLREEQRATNPFSQYGQSEELLLLDGADLVAKKQTDSKALGLQQRVDYYIELHYWENIDRDSIAETLFFSPSYLGRMYKRSAGISIADRVTERRIAHAQRLLKNPLIPIADVAGNVGFASQAYFSTQFKKLVGMTPMEYRRSIVDPMAEDDEKEWM